MEHPGQGDTLVAPKPLPRPTRGVPLLLGLSAPPGPAPHRAGGPGGRLEICALERGEFSSPLGEGLALGDCSGGLGLFFFYIWGVVGGIFDELFLFSFRSLIRRGLVLVYLGFICLGFFSMLPI